MSTDTGGPAFPSQEMSQSVACAPLQQGMTLRDAFAKDIMAAILWPFAEVSVSEGHSRVVVDPARCARIAYEAADALIAEKRRSEQ